MAIQFSCELCGTVLKTGDDKAGRQAKCPGCGEVIDIPASGTESAAPKRRRPGRRSVDEPDDYDDDVDDFDDDYDDDGYDDDDVDSGASRGRSKRCPMCGESVSSRARKCRHCGESLDLDSRGRSRSSGGFEVGEVLATSWEIFKVEWGVCLGALLLPVILYVGSGFAFGLLLLPFALALREAGEAGLVLFFIVYVTGVVCIALFQMMLQLGMWIILIGVARGRGQGINDLFSGGRYLGRMLINTIVLALAMMPLGLIVVAIGAAVPDLMFAGVILMYAVLFFAYLALWCYPLALVDQDLRGLEPLRESMRLTQGYRLQTFLLWLVLTVINVVGALPCGIGLFITLPLSVLTLAVAYCRLAGHRVAA